LGLPNGLGTHWDSGKGAIIFLNLEGFHGIFSGNEFAGKLFKQVLTLHAQIVHFCSNGYFINRGMGFSLSAG
jgi:hypothetical protein